MFTCDLSASCHMIDTKECFIVGYVYVDCRWDCESVGFFQAEDGIRDLVRSRGLGDVYKRQGLDDRVAQRVKPAAFRV